MSNVTSGVRYYLAVFEAGSVFPMQVGLILYALLAALLLLLIIAFFCFAVAYRCRAASRRKASPEWVTSASIEHLRFEPEPRGAPLRTSTPYYTSLEDVFTIHNQHRDHFYDQVANYAEPVLSPADMQVIDNKSTQLLKTFPQTFASTNEPKYIYWETCV